MAGGRMLKRLNAFVPWLLLALMIANCVMQERAKASAYESGLLTGKNIGRCEVQRPIAEALGKPDLIARVEKNCAGVERVAAESPHV